MAARRTTTGRITPPKAPPQISSASDWKKSSRVGTPITVPSGQTCLVRVVGMQMFLSEGIIPNSLLPIVNEALSKGTAPSQRELENSLDMDKARDMISLFDAVTVYCVVEPRVHALPLPEKDKDGNERPGKRDDELLYVDEVDFNDKVYIFQVAVGGTRDLETFRKELAAYVEGVPDDEGDAVSSK